MRISKLTWGMQVIAGLFLALPMAFAQDNAEKPAGQPGKLETRKQKLSYGLGRNIAGSIKNEELEVDVATLIEGIKDELEGKELRDPLALMVLESEMLTRRKKRREEIAKQRVETNPDLKAIADKNAAAGAAFLKENQAKEGVKVTQSGLQYQILKAGEGMKPSEFDLVETHYDGTLPDGTVFDSSVQRKEPESFRVYGVIDGWTEALQMMPVGSKWRLVIPAKLAYGHSGSGDDIGPNQVLVFEVELLKIVTPDDETGEAPPTKAPEAPAGNKKP